MANEKMREYWSTSAGGWVQHKQIFDTELAPFAALLIDTLAPGPRTRLLDIGCGTGILLELAAGQGATGLGVDISPLMIDAATDRVEGAEFIVADAQTDDLAARGPFDAVMSRFGVMFFDDPAAAFANIRRAAAPGAPLAFVCWRSVDENAMFSLGTSVIVDRMDPKPEPPPPGAPGPTAFADADHVRAILAAAGWADADVAPFDVMLDYGSDGSDGVEERLTMILGTSAGNVARREIQPHVTPEEWDALLDDVRAELRRHLVDGRVQFNAATWLVTARNPA